MKNENSWRVYCHTNRINGKRYIGVTSQQNLNRRFRGGKGYERCHTFYKAITKYGWGAFDTHIICDGLSKDEAYHREHQLVTFLRTKDCRYGYNATDGGYAPPEHTPKGRKAMSIAATGTNNPGARAVVAFDLSGKKIGEFPCIVYAQQHYGILIHTRHLKSQRGTCHNMIFRYKDDVGDIEQLSPEQVYQRYEQKLVRGGNSWHSTPTTVFDAITGEFVASFSCEKYASDFIGANCSSNIRGKSKTVGRYICKPSSEVCGIEKLSKGELPKYGPNGKAICQYDMSGNYLKTFPNAVAAEAETGVSRKQISNCVNHKSIVGGNYLWRLESDTTPLQMPISAAESRKRNGSPNGTKVDQIDLATGEVIATYGSLYQAATAVGTYVTSIRKIIDHVGNNKTAKGYGWRYHDESN